jgi:DNA-binding TFAR19-related protein (PDSD5 family)
MKFSFLKQIVTEEAYQRKENAGYAGAWNDGGCQSLLSRLETYQKGFVIKMDLRPSELNKLNDIEVGEPQEFSDIIENYKIKLAKNIKL